MSGEDRLRDFEEALDRLGGLRVANLREVWIEYDRVSDTIYVHFGREEAEEAIMVDDDVIAYVTGDRLVGLAFLNASRRLGLESP
ncbi:DUF2283 domain-containing protein [Stetteria hydrogenophila]